MNRLILSPLLLLAWSTPAAAWELQLSGFEGEFLLDGDYQTIGGQGLQVSHPLKPGITLVGGVRTADGKVAHYAVDQVLFYSANFGVRFLDERETGFFYGIQIVEHHILFGDSAADWETAIRQCFGLRALVFDHLSLQAELQNENIIQAFTFQLAVGYLF